MGRSKKRLCSANIREETRTQVTESTQEPFPAAVWMRGNNGNAGNVGNSSGVQNSGSSYHDTTDHERERPRKKRGPSTLNDIWKLTFNERKQVYSNKRGQPVGPYAVKFSSFIGIVVRTQCPLYYDNFSKVPGPEKKQMVGVIKDKFRFPSVLHSWLRKAMSKKFRDHKSDLKARYFSHEYPMDTNIKNCPPNLDAIQWKFLVTYWMSDKGKKAEKRARNSRLQQKVTHTSGSKTFARVGDEMEQKDGVEPGDIKVYEETHKRKDGSYLDPSVQDIVEKAKAKKVERDATLDEEIEILTELLGENRHGRVRGVGMGPTPTSVFGPFSSRARSDHTDEEFEKLQNQLAEQNGVIATLNNEVSTLKDQMAQLMRFLSQSPANPPGVQGNKQPSKQTSKFASSSNTSHRSARSMNQANI